MLKESDFGNKYEGITDGEAWQRNSEQGDNIINTQGIRQLKNFGKVIGYDVNVFRGGILKKVLTSKVVVGDTVAVEKGDIIPADGTILEEKGLMLSALKGKENINEFKEKTVYQGMKVLEGKAVILIAVIGANTYIGQIVKQILGTGKEKGTFYLKVIKALTKVAVLTGVAVLITFIACMAFNFIRYNQINVAYSFYAAAGVFIAMFPIEVLVIYLFIAIQIKIRAKKMKVVIKDIFTLGDMDKINVLCIDGKFLKEKNTTDIQRLYKSGIRVVLFSEEDEEKTKSIGQLAGVCGENAEVITGEEIKNMPMDKLREKVLDVILFAKMDSFSKLRVVQTLKNLGVSICATGDNIDDTLTIKFADVGISTSIKSDSIENEVAEITLTNDNLEFILETMRLGRKFRDSLRKTIDYVTAARVFALLFMIFAIVFDKPIGFFTLAIWVIYWAINPVIMKICGISDGDEDLLDRRNSKAMKKMQRIGSAIFQGIIVASFTIGAYFALEYFNIDSNIIKMSIAGLIIFINVILAGINNKRIVTKVKKEKIFVSEHKTPKKERLDNMKKSKL